MGGAEGAEVLVLEADSGDGGRTGCDWISQRGARALVVAWIACGGLCPLLVFPETSPCYLAVGGTRAVGARRLEVGEGACSVG